MFSFGKVFGASALSVALSLFATPVFAIDINGEYTSSNNLMKLRVIALNANDGNTTEAAAQIIASDGEGCAGDVAGIGKVVGTTFKFNSYTSFTSKCTITIKFNKDGSTGTISEKGCLDWHGAQCGFEGRVSR